MNVILDGTDNEVFDPATDLCVLVTYPHAAFALRAQAMLQRVGQAVGKPGRLIYSLWDFGCLDEPKLLRIAADAAVAADVIFLIGLEGNPLPKAVRDWIARWLKMKNNFPQALVASLHHDPKQAPPEPVLRRYLARVAEEGSMQFFAGDPGEELPVDPTEVQPEVAGESSRAGQAILPQAAIPTGMQSGFASIYATVMPGGRKRTPGDYLKEETSGPWLGKFLPQPGEGKIHEHDH